MATRTDEPKFKGFSVPQQNWFRLPNSWTDITADIQSLAELKIVEYVLRHTWGYQEYGISKRISTDEFMEGRKRADGSRMDRGTGLSNKSVIDGIRRAIEDGFLVEEIDDSDKGRIKKYYALKMLPEGMEEVHTPMKKVHSRGVDSPSQTEGSTHRTTERHSQETHSGNTLGETTTQVVADIVSYGVSEEKALEFAKKYDSDYLYKKMEFLDWKLSRPEGKKIEDVAAWLVAAVERNYEPPEGFETSWEREEREKRQAAERKAFHEELYEKRQQYLAEHPES